MSTDKKEPSQKSRFVLPVELHIRSAKNNALLAKIKEPQMPYSLTKDRLHELEHSAKQQHIPFEQALFEDMQESFKKSGTTQFYLESYARKHPHEQITFDLKLTGKIKRVTDQDAPKSSPSARKIKLYTQWDKKSLSFFYLFMLLIFLLAFIGVFYSAFHR